MATGDVNNKANSLGEAQIDDIKHAQQDSDPGPVIEKWKPMVDAIAEATKKAFPASPPFDPSSPSTFQTYWRGVFADLRDSALEDNEIPHYLTEPPLPTFTVTLFDRMHALRCPCCQSYSEPAIELRNEDGVTKGDLMNAVIDTLYGDVLPKVFIEQEPFRGGDDEIDDSEVASEDDTPDAGRFRNDSGVLIYTYSWMSSGGNDAGETIMYGDEPDVILYCCRPEEFDEMSKEEEEYNGNRESNL